MENSMSLPKLIVIAGPTAVGKTKIAIELAKRINGEIISADSMQVYKYMDIGTAKPTLEEMDGIKHYLIDEIEPNDAYSVAVFVQKSKEYLHDIYQRGKQPIIVGGTGFYINALVCDNNFMSTDIEVGNTTIREELYRMANEQGELSLHNMLMEIDPVAAERIHPNNVKRVIRAIEFHKLTDGKLISEHNDAEKLRTSPYDVSLFVLDMPRGKLYERIELRIDKMIEDGLVSEVQHLLDMGVSPDAISMRGLGYKEVVPYLQGHTTLDEATELLKRNTRRFAKRQLTWFKHQCPNATTISVDETGNESIINNIIRAL